MYRTQLGKSNWQSKYRFQGETPVGTPLRVAKTLASVEKEEVRGRWEAEFLKTLVRTENPDLIDQFMGRMQNHVPELDETALGWKAVPGGRSLANLGTPYKGATSINCFIVGPPQNVTVRYERLIPGTDKTINCEIQTEDNPDSLPNIMLAMLEQAETLKSEGGWGMNFGWIRPRSSYINGVGIKHPGVVKIMEMFDKVSEVIVAGDEDGYEDKLRDLLKTEEYHELKEHLQARKEGKKGKEQARKGAMMAVLPIDHPDVEEFIRAKQTSGKLTKFNISVLVTDEFMEAVEKGEFFDLKFKGEVKKRVWARDLYDLIMQSTYNRGEPGVLFYDTMQRNNPLAYMGEVDATNPCLAAGTLITTDKGEVPVENIKLRDMIKTIDGFKPVHTIETHGNKDVYEVTLENGVKVKATKAHIFHSKSKDTPEAPWDKETRLENLSTGDFIRFLEKDLETAVKIVDISYAGKAWVYDLYEKETDTWITSGIVNRGCGEIPGNSLISTVCLLGSLNATAYVRKDRTFDYELFDHDVAVFARMLDNVNDVTTAPLPQYRWAIENVRQYGMGITGLASAMLMMGIGYNTPEGRAFADDLFARKEDICWRTTALLAAEKGPMPAYNEKFLETHWFTKFTRISETTKDLIRKHGVRNGKVSMNAPNGNSSIICDNISNGIEPIFDFEYVRTRIADEWPEGLTLENVKQVLTQTMAGDAVVWQGEYNGQEYYYEPHNRGLCLVSTVRDYGYQWVLDNYPEDLGTAIEDENGVLVKHPASYLVTTRNLDVMDHVMMQEVAQRNVCQSISKTINVPHDYPYEDFKQIYMEGWKRGLIGCTTYRDGTMESVLSVANPEQKQTSAKREVRPNGVDLPDVFLNGPTKVFKREGMKFYSNFSYLPEDTEMKDPVVMWITTNHKGENIAAGKAVTRLISLLRSQAVDDDLVTKQVEKIKGDHSAQKIAKMVSMCLRHNLAIIDIIQALEGIDEDNVSSLLTAVRKFLSEFVADGTAVTGKSCIMCGSTDLVFQSGCSVCRSCNFSGCS